MTKWLDRLSGSWPGRFAAELVERYFSHDVGRQAAALAYYLLFTLFPFLIFINSFLGLLRLDVSGLLGELRLLLPGQVLTLLETYLLYVEETASPALFWFSLVFSVWFPMRAVRSLMGSVRRAYHLGTVKNRVWYSLKILLYTVTLLVTIAATLLLTTVGRRALDFIFGMLPLRLPQGFAEVWDLLRFGLLGVLVFGAVGLLYAMAQDTRQKGSSILPGALIALVVWMALSAGFSFYVAHFSNYSLIYGALGTVIILIVWLYLTAVVLIMGDEVNDTLRSMTRPRRLER